MTTDPGCDQVGASHEGGLNRRRENRDLDGFPRGCRLGLSRDPEPDWGAPEAGFGI